MQIFSYVIAHDSGFAPNPFGGVLTLATCKPRIRQQARIGDYVVGTGSSKTVGNHRMVYAAVVADVLTLADYGITRKYDFKRPSIQGKWWRKHGDNIYFLQNDQWIQRRNPHHNRDATEHDIEGKNVLVCNLFWYFGKDAIAFPAQLLSMIKKGSGHKRIRDESLVKEFEGWITSLPEGRHGMPEMEKSRISDQC